MTGSIDIADLEARDKALADTTINVNPGAPNAPRDPEFSLPRRSVETVTRTPMGAEPADAAPTLTTRTSREINWGRVIKGAAIVAAVALVAVVALTIVPPLVTGVVNFIGGNSVIGGAINWIAATAGPLLTSIGNLALGGVIFVGHAAVSLATAIFGAFGATGAAAGTAAAVAPIGVTAANAAAIGQGAGIIAAGGAVAVAAPVAAHALASNPLVDTVSHTVAVPAPTGHEHFAAQTHTQTLAQPDLQQDSQDQLVQHQQMMNMKTASKMVHHAAEDHAETAAHDGHRREALHKAWAERVGGPSQSGTRVEPRGESFADEINQDRAALDSALSHS